MKKPKIYISGAISYHDTEERKAAFQNAKKRLEAMGFEVFNPMENGLPQESPTSRHMRRDLNELSREDEPYDAIYMMKKWNHSAGCWTEFHAALAMGLNVYFEQDDIKVQFL